MDKASYEELTMPERENLRKSMEKLKGGASGILFCVTQLKGIQRHNQMVEAKIKIRSQELELKEKQLQSLSSDLDKRVEIFEKEKSEAGNLKKLVEESSANLQRLCSEARDWKKEMEEETDKRKKELSTILEQIKESGKQLESQRRLLEIKSLDLVSKEKDLARVKESIELSSSDLELKKKMVQSLNSEISVCDRAIDSKSKEAGEIQKLIEQQTTELVGVEKRHKEILEAICRSSYEMEERAKEIKAAETEASDLNVRSGNLRQEIEGRVKDLDLLKNQIESEEKKLAQLKRETEEVADLKKKDLELTLSKIEESGHQLAAVDEQLESQRRQIELRSVELLSKEMELEMLRESSKRFISDLAVKEKRFQALNNLIRISGEQLALKSTELGEIERELKFKKQLRQMITALVKREKQPAAAPVSDTSQQIAAKTEPIDEDALMLHGISASLTRPEVYSILRASPNPGELVLEQVQEEIREESTLQDTLLEIFVLLFDELAKIRQSDEVDKSQLQLMATEVATQWKAKITMEAPTSSLEALAFLLFIMAYGLKTLINEEETALLASSIAQYEQAPRLFKYLGLNPVIRECVEELIKKSQYIPAVRLICLFKLNKVLPSKLLKKEIINFRRSALENISPGSSQAKEKDGRRLRAILELVADYKLEIDLPGDLIAKLMVQGERLPPLLRCSIEHVNSSSDPQAALREKQLEQTKTVLMKHNGVEEKNLGTSLPVCSSDVNSTNETSKSMQPPVVYTYQRRGN